MEYFTKAVGIMMGQDYDTNILSEEFYSFDTEASNI